MRVRSGLNLFVAVCLISGSSPAASAGGSDWLSQACATGRLALDAAAGYGKGTDWAGLFYSAFVDIAAAPDGALFAASAREHKIFRFDAEGRLGTSSLKNVPPLALFLGIFSSPLIRAHMPNLVSRTRGRLGSPMRARGA